MTDDDTNAEGVLSISDTAMRAARIRKLSNGDLLRYYDLLSDSRVVENVAALPAIEHEMKLRGLWPSRPH